MSVSMGFHLFDWKLFYSVRQELVAVFSIANLSPCELEARGGQWRRDNAKKMTRQQHGYNLGGFKQYLVVACCYYNLYLLKLVSCERELIILV